MFGAYAQPTWSHVGHCELPRVEPKRAGRIEHRQVPKRREGPEERTVAKNKGKRGKSRRDGGLPEIDSVTATQPAAAVAAQSGTAPSRSEVVEGIRVEGNVIHLPKPAGSEESVSSRPTMRAGSGWSDSPQQVEDNPLRSDEGEAHRTTVPPEAGETEASEVSGEVLSPVSPVVEAETKTEKADAKTEKTEPKADVKTEPKADVKTEPKADVKTEPKADAKTEKADAKTEKAESKKDVVIGRGERRDRKESLSAHLSDEAKAFFSDKSLEAAYKPHHDNFEDLTPAHEDHAHDVARSRKWMRVTGLLLVGVVAVIGAFAMQSRYGVQETVISTPQYRPDPAPPAPPAAETPTPPPAAETPTPPPATETPAPAPAAETPAPPPAAETPAPAAAAETPAPAPAAETPAAPAAPVAPPPAPAAETPAPPAPAAAAVPAAPSGDAAALLSAARRSGRIDAWEAYFNAAPTEDRLMASTAMGMAERGRNADAERLAQRAVTANPENGQGWFVLAVVRGALRNRDGAREAKQRCIALGGRWAGECRGI
jgi:hypothetical protein